MEIVLLSESALRIKGKKTTLLFDVLDTTKTEANAYLFLTKNYLEAKQGKNTLIIARPGEYEVSGAKISAFVNNQDVYYQLIIDEIRIFLTRTSTFSRIKDKVDEQNIVILCTDEMIDQSALTNAQPGIVLCYGHKAAEVSANLGKGLNKKEDNAEVQPDASIKPTDKFVITAEKLPTEMQVVLLG